MAKSNGLFDLGWGSPDEQAIGKPLQYAGQIVQQTEKKIAAGISASLRQATERLERIWGQLGGRIAENCQRCIEAVNQCERQVYDRITDKLVCVNTMLDNVCANCPGAVEIIQRALEQSQQLIGEQLAAEQPIQPSRPAVSDSFISPSPGEAYSLPPVSPPTVASVPSGGPTLSQPQFSGGLSLPVQPTNMGSFELPRNIPPTPGNTIPGHQEGCLGNPITGEGPTGLHCVYRNPVTRSCTARGCDIPYPPPAPYYLEFCTTNAAEFEAYYRANCQQLPTPQPPPPQPPPPPPTGQPPQCIVCNQCHPPTNACPPCPEKDKTEFCAWKQESGACYVLKADSRPLLTSDRKLDCSRDLAALASLMQSACGQSGAPSTPQPSNPVAAGINSILCSLLSYAPGNLPNGFANTRIIGPLINLFLGVSADIDASLSEAREQSQSLNPITAIVGAVKLWWFTGIKQVDESLLGSLRRSGCIDAKFVDVVGSLSIVQLIERWIVGDLPWITTPLKYTANTICPVMFPGVEAATEAWLKGQIDEQTYFTWVRQNNHCTEPWHRVALSRQARLAPFEAAAALRRGLITEEGYREIIRANGFISNNAPDVIFDLTRPLPPISDLIRFMVRDVEDPGIVGRFGLDEGFTDKWQGQAREWGEQQGITDDVALRYWRAHWSIPSPTQLFAMYHRSRGLDPSHPAYVDLSEIEAALVYQDIAPFWVKPLLNTTFSLLRLVDINRAYELGAIDRDGVFQQLVKRGYSDDDANIITTFYDRQKQERLLRHPAVRAWERGELSRVQMERRVLDRGATAATIERIVLDAQPKLVKSRPVKLFERWQINERELIDELTLLGADPETIRQALFIGRRVRYRSHRQRCLTAIRKRYLWGEFDDAELRDILVTSGASADEAEELIPLWRCERLTKPKEFSAAQLCDMVEKRLISPLEMHERLMRMGWSDEDSFAIVAGCGMKIGDKAAKQLEKLQKERERLAEKARKAIERQQKAAERKLQQEEARLKKLAAAEEAREKRLIDIIARLVQLTGATHDDAGAFVRRMRQELYRDYVLTANERVHVIVRAIERDRPTTLADAEISIIELADEAEQTASFNEQIPEATNGEGSR